MRRPRVAIAAPLPSSKSSLTEDPDIRGYLRISADICEHLRIFTDVCGYLRDGGMAARTEHQRKKEIHASSTFPIPVHHLLPLSTPHSPPPPPPPFLSIPPLAHSADSPIRARRRRRWRRRRGGVRRWGGVGGAEAVWVTSVSAPVVLVNSQVRLGSG
jgi:hypothetical protein